MRRIQSNTFVSHDGKRAKIVTHGGYGWRCTKRISAGEVIKKAAKQRREAGLDNMKPADGYSMFRDPAQYPQDRMTKRQHAIAEAVERAKHVPWMPPAPTVRELQDLDERLRDMGEQEE